MDEAKRAKLYEDEVAEASSAVNRWLAHEATAGVIAEASRNIQGIIGQMEAQFPELRLLDKGELALFAVAAVGQPPLTWGVVNPDGSTQHWPVLSEWLCLTDSDQEQVRDLCSLFADELRQVARSIYDAGAAIDPAASCDLVALAQILVDPATLDRIADDLYIFGPVAISRDGRGTGGERDGRGEKGVARTNAIRRDWRRQQADHRGERLQNRGGRPVGANTADSDTEAMRRILPQLLIEFPNVTARSLNREWRSGDPNTPGRRLRDLMGRTVSSPTPGESSIRTALKEIRTNNP